jgi:hypothetical protein
MALTEETLALRTRQDATAADSGSGLVLRRYRLGRRLGAGGFGTVHEAVDEELGRRVAVKVIPADGSAPERARREAVAAARLDHPGIVAIFDAGEEPGARYLVSELVEGRTLAQLEVEGELSDRDVLRVGLAMCDALMHAHERGVVHRDIKPQNILVPDRPRTWRGAAKLADFGVAMLAGDEPLTMTGDVVGTLAYMAPEQAAGKRVDHRADIYATALVLYEGLAGLNPVRAASPAATAKRVGQPVPSLQRQRRDLPPELCGALDRALSVEPARRGTLDDLADALEEALPDIGDEGGTVVRHPLERDLRIPRGAPRAAAAFAAAALAAGAVLICEAPIVPAPAAGLIAALLVALLPRVGWLAAAAGTIALLVLDQKVGAAMVAAIAVSPVWLLLRRAPLAWSAPALAPLLGAATLAGAFPAVAGRLARWPERAALGALGAWWLLLAEPLLPATLMWGPAPGVPTRSAFDGAFYLTAGDVVAPTATSGAMALIGVWALAAAVMPWVARGRSLAVRIVGAAVWAGALGAGTAALAQALELPEPRGLVAGAILAGAVAAAPDRAYSSRDDGD